MNPALIAKLVATGTLAATALVGGVSVTQHGPTQHGPTQHGPTQHGPTQHGPTQPVAAPTATAAAAATSDQPVRCHARLRFLRQAPAPLTSDLKALRALPKGDARRAAAKKIRSEALSGGYGAQVQKVAEARKAEHAAFLSEAPADFRADVKAALAKPRGPERRDALQAIGTKAVDGGYGAEVQQRAEKRQQHRETCRAQRAERRTQQG